MSHFYCFVINMNFVYTYRRKTYTYDIIKEFLKMIKIRYNLVVGFIRTNKECTFNDKYTELIRNYDIITERSILDILK